LGNIRDRTPARSAHGRRAHGKDIQIVDADLPARDPRAGPTMSQQRQRNGRFA
jgi:hypothetical protein